MRRPPGPVHHRGVGRDHVGGAGEGVVERRQPPFATAIRRGDVQLDGMGDVTAGVGITRLSVLREKPPRVRSPRVTCSTAPPRAATRKAWTLP